MPASGGNNRQGIDLILPSQQLDADLGPGQTWSVIDENGSSVIPTNLITAFETCVGAVVRYSPLLSLLRLAQRHKVPILMYHSISTATDGDKSCMALAESETSIERFRAQMAYIARHYNTISIQDFVQWHSGKKQLPQNPCIITLDDGFADSYENALPILQQFELTATFFIIGVNLTSSHPSWLHELYGILDSAPVDSCLSGVQKGVAGFPPKAAVR